MSSGGVPDPNFPDIPLGGWAGTVEEVERHEGETTVLVAWNRATLRGMHPIYKKRCERDGLELESMWLGDEDLEPDDGTPVPIEQPTSIVTKPLSEEDEDDRVRMVFGLTHDDLLPEVTEDTLLAYHRYLSAHLKFPIPITIWMNVGPHSDKKVRASMTGLAHPSKGGIDDDGGLVGLGAPPMASGSNSRSTRSSSRRKTRTIGSSPTTPTGCTTGEPDAMPRRQPTANGTSSVWGRDRDRRDLRGRA